MNKLKQYFIVGLSLVLIMSSVSAKILLSTPDGRTINLKGGVTQPDLSLYRSPLDSTVVDRRFYTNDATFMANESFKFGMEGFNDMVKGAYPVAYRRAFQWVTAREMYFYARYLLDFNGGRGHAGVHMLHGPYWTLKAQIHSNYNKVLRDRGERKFSNKDVLLGFYLPLVYQRTGFPRVFEDIQLVYLPYKSVDPHFSGEVKSTDTFEDIMSGKKGGWGQPESYFNDFPQRFDHDKMDTTFDMGAVGQFVKRRMQWSDLFYHSNHQEESIVSKGQKVNLLGNDAEEGMRGWGLAMSALNAMLEVKSSMFTDGSKLMGINPVHYDPAEGLRYIPHEIEPNLLWIGDLPERVWSIDLKDNSSQLWDQASWIWGTSAYATTVNRRTDAFTPNAPVDGGVMESSTGRVAEAMANAIFKNVEAMHTKGDILVSEWTPENGAGDVIQMRDLTMMMVALRDLEQSWGVLKKYDDIASRARTLLDSNAKFLLKVQNPDGSFCTAYRATNASKAGACDESAAHWGGIRALVAAYYTTENEDYLAAARKTFNLLNKNYWVEQQGVYRSRLNDDIVEVTPYNIGIALSGLREILFTTPTYVADPQIERITRWWVQTVNQSGAMQAETNRTGEIYSGFLDGDDDGDGIATATKAHGKYGIAPLIAGKVLINLNGNKKSIVDEGEQHNPNRLNKVRMRYQTQTTPLIIPERYAKVAGLVERKPMQRIDGTTIPMQPSKPIKTGLGSVLDLSGQQIFEANCSNCHGQHGEGMDGHPLERAMSWGSSGIAAFASAGAFDGFMPPWGIGNGDPVGGTLTSDELRRIGDYVGSEAFKRNYEQSQRGEVVAGALPKDVWFYLSRENINAGGNKISGEEDARRLFSQHPDPAELQAEFWENLQRTKPDAELSMEDRKSLLQAYE